VQSKKANYRKRSGAVFTAGSGEHDEQASALTEEEIREDFR